MATMPSPNPIPNAATVSYEYIVDPSEPPEAGQNVSNTVYTQANMADLTILKTADKAYADINETITYTLEIRNTGNVDATNVVLKDIIADDALFTQGSVRIDNISMPLENPSAGIRIGDIAADTAKIVIYEVKAVKVPSGNILVNSANVTYSFTIDPNFPNAENGENNSNEVNVRINHAEVAYTSGGFTKSVNMQSAKTGDILIYSLYLKNNGNVSANNISVTDSIPEGAAFIADSLTLNGTAQPGAEIVPPASYTLGTLAPGESVTIAFSALIAKLPETNPLINGASINYSYTVDPSTPNAVHVTEESNKVATTVNEAIIDYLNGGGLVKSVDKAYSKLGDILTYTIRMTNTGNTPAAQIVFTDPIPSNTAFVENSVTLNGIRLPGASVDTGKGVNAGTLNAGESAVITFSVTVNAIPPQKKITNAGYVKFQYTLDPARPYQVDGEGSTNTVETEINSAVINYVDGTSFVKSADKAYAESGDTIQYTVTVENIGNASASNVILTDIIPGGTQFVENSMYYNGAYISGSPASGVNLGSLSPGVRNRLVFSVMIIDIPNVNPIPNVSTVTYDFTTDPSSPMAEKGTGTSNTVYTTVVKGQLSSDDFVKSSDKEYVKRNDVITYSLNISNTGNVSINNAVLLETLPQGTDFVAGSVIINGVSYPAYSPEQGIPIGSIAPGARIAVTIKYTVESVPYSGVIVNTAVLRYGYTVDPVAPDLERTIESNEVDIYVREASIDASDGGFIKSADKQSAGIGDEINYTLNLTNTGNIAADNCILRDALPSESEFVAGSVIIDNISYPTFDITSGITLGTIQPNESKTVKFKAVIKSLPASGYASNKAEVSFNFTPAQGEPAVNGNGESNEVRTQINAVDFTGNNFVKTSTPVYVSVGDIITYRYTIINGGNINALNVILKDKIPVELEFVQNSAEFNGTAILNPDFTAGINLGTIQPASGTNIFTFKAKVISAPAENPIKNTGSMEYEYIVNATELPRQGKADSNTAENSILTANIEVSKQADKVHATTGDILTYKLTVKNTGNAIASSVHIFDALSAELEFVPESITIDGTAHTGFDIITGFDIGAVLPGQTVNVEFKAKVTGIPSNGQLLKNKIAFRAAYIVDPEEPPRIIPGESSESETHIESAEVTVTKISDNDSVRLYDIVTYSVAIKNTGTLSAKGIVFYDILPANLEFVKGSVILNGNASATADIEKGITIGTIISGEKASLTYKVTVIDDGGCQGIVSNKAYVQYKYSLTDGGEDITKTTDPTEADIRVYNPAFRQLSLDGTFDIPCEKPDIEDINDLTAGVEIIDFRIIKTPIGKAKDNSVLTGYKLLITGRLRQVVEYTADDVLQSVHSAHYSKVFSTYIVLSKNVSLNSKVQLTPLIEDIYYKQLNSRQFFANITVMINAAIINIC